MQWLLVTIVVSAYAPGTLQAQPAGYWGTPLEDSRVPNWLAQWIWLPEIAEADMLLARKTFTLPEVPDEAVLSITATSRYQLFVNGKYHCSGPARCASHYQSFDLLDTAIRPGIDRDATAHKIPEVVDQDVPVRIEKGPGRHPVYEPFLSPCSHIEPECIRGPGARRNPRDQLDSATR